MVVDAVGRAYVGNFGWDYEQGGSPVGAVICRVDPDGTVSVAAKELLFPNGTVITPDGRTLIVAESFSAKLIAFDIDTDGGLSNRRVWADLSGAGITADGIALDAEGCIWVATAFVPRCVRVAEGGEVVGEVTTEKTTYACMLGGPDGRTLFNMTAPDARHDKAGAVREGSVEIAQVDVPHAGLP
jgi:sugar lactone lactonase YvrE